MAHIRMIPYFKIHHPDILWNHQHFIQGKSENAIFHISYNPTLELAMTYPKFVSEHT